MKKEIMVPLILILTATVVTAQVPTYHLECVLPAPGGCTSVDISPDGTKLCARMTYGDWDEGYREFDVHTYEVVEDHYPLGSAPWRGLISADNQYLWHTVYYGGKVEKLDLSTKNTIVKSLDIGSWTYGLAFDSSRRYLYAGENCPGTGTIGSLQVIDTNSEIVVGSVALNGEPGFHIVVDSLDEFVYIMSKNSGTETLYKIRTSDYGVDTLSLPGVGEPGISISQNGVNVYVPHPAADLVYKIDTGTMSVSGSWSIPSVVGFFVSPDGTHALVVGSSPDIRVFDLVTEDVVQTISIPDIGTSFAPGKSIPYWVGNNGKVYINLSANEGGVAVLNGSVTLLAPNGGESWVAGKTENIQWGTAVDANIPEVKIEYSANNGQDWNDVNTVPNTGSYEWILPEVTSNQCLIRISDSNNANIYDVSDDVFTIFECRRSDVIYSQDFSSDPAWITDQPSNFHWDSSKEIYAACEDVHVPDPYYAPNRYGYVPTTMDSSKSFRLKWEQKMTRSDWSSEFHFGLMGADLAPSYSPECVKGQSAVGLDFWHSDQGQHFILITVDSAGNYQMEYDLVNSFFLNTPYNITLEYDATTRTLSATVINSETSEQVTYLSISDAGPFSEEMVNLGASNYGMCDCGYSGVNPDAKACAEIDNVVLSVSYIGKLVGDLNDDCYSDFRDFAIFAEHWLECGNPFDPDCGVR